MDARLAVRLCTTDGTPAHFVEPFSSVQFNLIYFEVRLRPGP